MLLVGRRAEQKRIARLLQDARNGQSGVLVVRGRASAADAGMIR